jgi:hypothetical protein
MSTPLEVLAEALLDCRKYASGAEAPPEAILWCDPGSEFLAIVPALRARLPNLLTFGAYEPAPRTGPALWLRAAAGRHVSDIEWPADAPAIIYIPGHGREILRGAEDCPADLAPLVWLAVAGSFFSQPKQVRDWTLRGFLAAQGSPVGLDIPEDKATREALGRAAARLFTEPVEPLKGRRLDAAALDGLLVPDPVADMLRWMDGTLTADTDPQRFAAFASLAAKQMGFDPRKRSPQDAAGRLAKREKAWAKVWDRFEEANGAYDDVVKLLRLEEPQSLFERRDAYPILIERGENELRAALVALANATPERAAGSVADLEERHGWRRETIWAKRGEARLAQALEHLAVVAQAVALPARDAQALAEAYLVERVEGRLGGIARARHRPHGRRPRGRDRSAARRVSALARFGRDGIAEARQKRRGTLRPTEQAAGAAGPGGTAVRGRPAHGSGATARGSPAGPGRNGPGELRLVGLSDRDRHLQRAGEPGGGRSRRSLRRRADPILSGKAGAEARAPESHRGGRMVHSGEFAER